MNDRKFGIAGPGASRYPIELEAPDIGPYRAGNCEIEYVSSFDSGKAGPHLMLAALTHGNELCGAIALDYFSIFIRQESGAA